MCLDFEQKIENIQAQNNKRLSDFEFKFRSNKIQHNFNEGLLFGKFSFKIENEPVEGQTIIVNCELDGTNKHSHAEVNHRNIKGDTHTKT